MELITYLNFDGNCRAAMEFYARCFDAELYIMPFADAPADLLKTVGDAKDRVMHATLNKGRPILMAADTMPGRGFTQGNNFSVSMHSENIVETEKLFGALSENGNVTMPLQETFWAVRFGMLTDQFGVSWLFNLGKSSA